MTQNTTKHLLGAFLVIMLLIPGPSWGLEKVGIELQSNNATYKPGDMMELSIRTYNMSRTSYEASIYVAVELNGYFYFYPNFTSWPEPYMNVNIDLRYDSGMQSLFSITVEDSLQSSITLNWYAAVIDLNTGEALSKLAHVATMLEPGSSSGEQLIPAAVGNEWTYKTEVPFVGPLYETRRVVDTVDLSGQMAYEVTSDISVTQYVGYKSDGYYIFGTKDAPNPMGTIYYKWPASVGEHYTTDILGQTGVFTLESTNATVSGPLGQFDGCIKYKAVIEGIVNWHYLKPGIGLLKVETQSVLGMQETFLISYTLN